MISIIIPTYNRKQLLKKCLNSVFNSSYKKYEVIVVDDCSTDDTSETVKKFKCKYIKLKLNQGVGNARNIGAQHAQGEILFFIDSDVVIKKNTLKNLVKDFHEHPNLELMCGYKLPKNLSKNYSSDFVMLRKTYRVSEWLERPKKTVTNSFIETAAFAIKKHTFTKLEGFSTRFKRSGVEDHEFGHRISQKYPIYFFKNLGVYHHFEPISSYLKKIFIRTYHWGNLFFKRKKFEKEGIATKSEAISSLLSLFFLIFLFGTFFYFPFLFFSLFFLIVLLIRRWNFYFYVFKKKSAFFTTIMILFDYLVYSINGFMGMVALTKKNFENVSSLVKELYYLFRAFISGTPMNIGLFVTSRCNLRCKHCFYWKQIKQSANKNELTLEEIKKISKNLDTVYYLTITGGEPSLRNDLPEICETFYKNNNLRMISFHTNGMLPEKIKKQTKQIFEKCKNVKINIGIGVDGLKKTHNFIRGNDKSFKNVLKTISYLKKLRISYPNLDIQCCSTFSSYSIKGLLNAANYFQNRLGIQFGQTFVRGNSHYKQAKNVSLEEFQDYYKKRTAYSKDKRKFYRTYSFAILKQVIGYFVPVTVIKTLSEKAQVLPCKAGLKTIVINEVGEVFPCEMLNKKMGDLRETDYDLKKILSNKVSQEIIKGIREKKCYCTHEGNMYVNLIFNYRYYPKYLLRAFKILKWK